MSSADNPFRIARFSRVRLRLNTTASERKGREDERQAVRVDLQTRRGVTTRPRLQAQFPSPIGGVRVTVNDAGAVVSVAFVDDELTTGDVDGPAAAAARQLEEYFAGTRTVFELKVAPVGTDFEKRVWKDLVGIPFGATETYGAIANRLGDPGASRAVGVANARNPIAIIIPCHRVIGSDGDLTGYAGGLHRKRWLLEHESGQGRLAF